MVEVKKAPKKLAIIDGKSVFYRGYYAMPNLSTPDGTPTGGVFGFATMALEVLRRLKPDYVCVAWDKPKTNIRKRLKLYPEYKAGRKPAPPDFYEQIPVLHELLDAFGWPLYELDDYEADDIMGTLALQAADKDIDTMLITSDLDMLQLVHPKVHVYALKKGLSNIELFRPETFILKYGITPEQFLDLKALKGDSSDNIPGVPGVGEKTALELLKEYKTLDNVYKNLPKVKDTLRAKLEAGKDSAYLSKKLAAIWTDAPIKLDLKAVDGSKVDPARLQALLQKLQFRSLLRQLPEIMKVSLEDHAKSQEQFDGQLNIGKHNLINSNEQLASLKLAASPALVMYGRAGAKHGRDPQLLILSSEAKQTAVLNLTKLDKKAVQKFLSTHLNNKASLVGYDIKSTLEILIELGVPLPAVGHDVLIGAFLLNPLIREQSLTELAQADLGYDGSSFEDLDQAQLVDRAAEITGVITALYEKQTAALAKLPKLIKLARDIEWPVIPVIARMEYEGIQLDTDYLKKMSEQLDDMVLEIEQKIYGHADQEFNIGSPIQLADILFNKLNLPKEGIKKGKTGYSTAATELDKLRGAHPIIDLVTQWREVTKLKNTYVDVMPKMVDENSRLHTTYALTVAQTGRLSSNDPNLQNIPVRTDLGKQIRTAFVAGKGKILVSADYSQFELRLAAYLSGDKRLIDMFNRDVDVHTTTAAEIYGREEQDVTKNMRREAKVVNFGVMYGLSTHGLVQATGLTYEQAKNFIDKYFEVRPKLRDYIGSVQEMAKTKGYTETIFGRRRPTPDIHSSNFAVREAAMRQAVNMPFQGSAADIMKLAMIAVQSKLDEFNQKYLGLDAAQGSKEERVSRTNGTMNERLTLADTAMRQKRAGISGSAGQQGSAAHILLQIHDSLIVECNEKDADKTAKLLKDTMEHVYKLPVKLTVDTAIGKNWGEL